MDRTNPSVAKKLRDALRVILFVLRKGTSKGKLTFGIDTLMNRGNSAGKAINDFISYRTQRSISSPSAPCEYEFSCSNTPAAVFPFCVNKRRYSHFFGCARAPATEDDDLAAANAVKMALEMIRGAGASPLGVGPSSAVESPWLSGRTPTARELRVTDSPFPLVEREEDNHVDEAANEFIIKFYRNLRKQNALAVEC